MARDGWHYHTIQFLDGATVSAPCSHCGEAEIPGLPQTPALPEDPDDPERKKP